MQGTGPVTLAERYEDPVLRRWGHALCAGLPDDSPDPARFPRAYCFWLAEQETNPHQRRAKLLICSFMPDDISQELSRDAPREDLGGRRLDVPPPELES